MRFVPPYFKTALGMTYIITNTTNYPVTIQGNTIAPHGSRNTEDKQEAESWDRVPEVRVIKDEKELVPQLRIRGRKARKTFFNI